MLWYLAITIQEVCSYLLWLAMVISVAVRRESVCLNPRSQTTTEGNEVRNLKAFLPAITQGMPASQPEKKVTLQSEKNDRNHRGCCFLPGRRVHDKVAFSTVPKNDASLDQLATKALSPRVVLRLIGSRQFFYWDALHR